MTLSQIAGRLGCAAVQDAAPELVERYAPGHGPHSRPGAFWMRRR